MGELLLLATIVVLILLVIYIQKKKEEDRQIKKENMSGFQSSNWGSGGSYSKIYSKDDSAIKQKSNINYMNDNLKWDGYRSVSNVSNYSPSLYEKYQVKNFLTPSAMNTCEKEKMINAQVSEKEKEEQNVQYINYMKKYNEHEEFKPKQYLTGNDSVVFKPAMSMPLSMIGTTSNSYSISNNNQPCRVIKFEDFISEENKNSTSFCNDRILLDDISQSLIKFVKSDLKKNQKVGEDNKPNLSMNSHYSIANEIAPKGNIIANNITNTSIPLESKKNRESIAQNGTIVNESNVSRNDMNDILKDLIPKKIDFSSNAKPDMEKKVEEFQFLTPEKSKQSFGSFGVK